MPVRFLFSIFRLGEVTRSRLIERSEHHAQKRNARKRSGADAAHPGLGAGEACEGMMSNAGCRRPLWIRPLFAQLGRSAMMLGDAVSRMRAELTFRGGG